MGLLLIMALLSAAGTLVDSASNKTDCDAMPSSNTCTQTTCAQLPCSMLCGVTTQYDACTQLCNSRKCDALRCRASNRCIQLCDEGTCGPIACDAKHCTQRCYQGNCSSLTCPETVKSCTQYSGRKMICEAVACYQTCNDDGGCEMTCPVGGTNCTQTASKGDAAMECDRGVCDQQCVSGAQCKISCSSNQVESGRCQQLCYNRDQGKCESMVCKSKTCTQVCYDGECNMACPNEVKSCTQILQSGGNATLRCDGDVCTQSCYGNCSMICSASVKDCHQICASGSTCLYKCEAEKCRLTCSGTCTDEVKPTNDNYTNDNDHTNGSDTPFQLAYTVLWGLVLAFIVYM